ncbi:outer membrane protein [Cetobacterium ceti]|uniref:Outer membrane protein n=1 Tax=Cetobacterium ceti TaxID=180163 RepID=A0A1T4M982_9FUSO|nr:MipA/OmpV family protein [Cetobacterium ceti]SJZ63264.1 outer membrane protein [Cetobacterium ceti]
MKKLLLGLGILSAVSMTAFGENSYDNTGYDQFKAETNYEGNTVATPDNDSTGNKFGIGLGVGTYKSLYKGVGSKAYPIPMFDIKYDQFYVVGTTIGYELLNKDKFTMSLFVNPLDGYKVKGSDLSNGYKDIDNRDYQAMFGARLDMPTPIDGLRTGIAVSGGDHGYKGRVGLYKPYNLTPRFTLVPAVHMIYYSQDFTDYYFGVDSSETFASRRANTALRNSYSPDGAYSYGAMLTGEYRFKDNMALTAFLGAEKYSSEITNSPIVSEDVIYTMGLGAKYYF